jgi:uncharacterized protein (DUF983 family)
MNRRLWKAGFLCLCPACSNAPLFDGLLTIKESCLSCGADFKGQDSGDGPAIFVILAAGIICVPFILIAGLVLKPPVWLLLVIALPLTAFVCIGLLRPFKAILFAVQWFHQAGEAVSTKVLKEEEGKNGSRPK